MSLTMKAALIVAVACLCTLLTRALPFLLFRGGRTMPKALSRLTGILPPAIIAVLVVYCLKGLSFSAPVELLSSLAGLVCVVGLHLWKRNTLLSIAAGTVVYMILIRIL